MRVVKAATAAAVSTVVVNRKSFGCPVANGGGGSNGWPIVQVKSLISSPDDVYDFL